MDSRFKLSPNLLSLISKYERSVDQGNRISLGDNDFYKIITYYEDEFELDRALDVLENAIQQHAFRSDFLNLKARLLIKKGKLDDALHTVEFAEQMVSNKMEVQLLKAHVFILQRRFEDAKALISAVKSTCELSDMHDIHIAESFYYDALQRYDLMFQSLKQALLLKPTSIEALMLMNASVENSKNYEESVLLHRVIVDNHPYNYLAWYNLGSAYGSVGEYEKAIDALEYSFIINPDFERGYLECAEHCLEVQRYQQALDIYRETIDHFGPAFESYLNIAHCLYALGDIAAAKQALFEAIEIDSYDDEALFLLARCNMQDGNYHNAIKLLKKAIAIENSVEEYYYLIAQAYHKLGKLRRASYFYRKAANSAYEVAAYWEDYVILLVELGELRKALNIAQRADNYTVSQKLLYITGAIKVHLGNHEEGLDILQEALTESFEDHVVLESLPPFLKNNEAVKAIVKYFSKYVD